MLRNKERLQHVRKPVSFQNPLYSETQTPAPGHQENWPIIFKKLSETQLFYIKHSADKTGYFCENVLPQMPAAQQKTICLYFTQKKKNKTKPKRRKEEKSSI